MKKAAISLLLTGLVHAVVAAPATWVQSVTYNGETITMRMELQNLRGAHFELWAQNSSGTYDVITPVAERSYIGTVDEYPGAISCGIIQDDGQFRGAIYFDRGGTWFTLGGAVSGTRGDTQPASFSIPGWTTTAGMAGTTMYGFDVGIDADHDYYTVRAGSNIAKTFELIEFSVAATRALYMNNALLRPYLGRVIIRTDAAQDPANGLTGGNYLDAVRNEWNNNHTDADRDVVAGISAWDVGGGLAWVGVIGTSSAYSVNDSSGDGEFTVIWRHEMGHNWGMGHFNGGAPEGATINSGNQYARMSGPELANALIHRNDRITWGIFDNEGTYTTVDLPPYAAIDSVVFVQTVDSQITINVMANDHDANGHSLSILSFDATTANDGTVSLQGQNLVYTPKGTFLGVDSFTYTIQDSSGQTATGAVAVDVRLNPPLKLYVPLDETTGTTAADQSGSGNNGTLQATTFDVGSVPGQFGNALQFDGVGDHVAFELGPALSGQTDFSVSAWIKTSSATDQVIIQQRDWRGYNGEYQFRVNANGTLQFMVYGNEAYQYDFGTTATVNDGQWHFVTAVRDGMNGYIYIDGNPTPAASASGTIRDLDAGIGVVMGRDSRDGISNFNGSIDEARIHAYALNTNEITALFHGGGAESPSPFDGATDVNLPTTSWTPVDAVTSHQVYIGTNQTAVSTANTGSPEYQGSSASANWIFDLQPNTTYFWRVDSVTPSNTIPGTVWSFTTDGFIHDLDLVAHWKLDEAIGTIAADSSANNNVGVLQATTFDVGSVTGKIGNALQFDGVSSHVAFELGPSLSGQTDFTVTAWIKTSSATDQVILQQRDWRGYNGQYQFRLNSNGTLHFMLYGNEDFQFNFSTTTTVNDGQWHFVAAVREGMNGYIYIDGSPTPAATASGPVRDLDAGIGVVMGRDSRDGHSNFNGSIDEAKVYNVALDGSAVSNLYDAYVKSSAAAPSITLGGSTSGYDIALSWLGENGVSYGVQTNGNLVDGMWNSYITNLIGDGGTITFTNDIDEEEMFFRIIVE